MANRSQLSLLAEEPAVITAQVTPLQPLSRRVKQVLMPYREQMGLRASADLPTTCSAPSLWRPSGSGKGQLRPLCSRAVRRWLGTGPTVMAMLVRGGGC